ncbi:MAG: hypothetical protein GVY17_01505 [Cyanobacteria bacterium]|nr:hypothetical protein [Cyanobacteria bacterium GSL.Bin21]
MKIGFLQGNSSAFARKIIILLLGFFTKQRSRFPSLFPQTVITLLKQRSRPQKLIALLCSISLYRSRRKAHHL